MVKNRKKEKLTKESSDAKGIFRVRTKESSFAESKQNIYNQEHSSTSSHFTKHQGRSIMDFVFWITVGVAYAVGIACIVLVIYWSHLYGGFAWNSNANLQFFWHPLLMFLGLIFFYGNAIMSYRILYFLPKWILKLIHAGIHFAAIILSTIGLVSVFEYHRRTNRPDFYSLHSWVGIAVFAFFCLQYVVSFLAFLIPGAPLSIRAGFMPFHTFFGIGIFILAVATAQMGLTEKLIWTKNYTSGQNVMEGILGNTLGLLLIVFAFLVVFLATHERYKRKPLPSEITPTN